MLKEKCNKVKNFVKEHKKAIAICETVIVGGLIFVVAKPKNRLKVTNKVGSITPDYIAVPKRLAKYGVDFIADYTGAIELGTGAPDYKVLVSELGAFGKDLCLLNGITPKSEAFVLINIAKKNN